MLRIFIALFGLYFGFISQNLSAQEKQSEMTNEKQSFRIKYFEGLRSDFGLSYNNFKGQNAEEFKTTIRGFSSGFFFDFFTARISYDLISVGTDNINLSLGAGFASMNNRFEEDLIIENEQGVVTWRINKNVDHDYGEFFFEPGKTKMETIALAIPINLNLHLGPFYVGLGGTYDTYLTGKLVRKYRENDTEAKDVRKIVVPNSEFKNFPLNKSKLGLHAALLHKPSGLNASITYMTTPVFKEGLGPDLNEIRISMSYYFSTHLRKRTNR